MRSLMIVGTVVSVFAFLMVTGYGMMQTTGRSLALVAQKMDNPSQMR